MFPTTALVYAATDGRHRPASHPVIASQTLATPDVLLPRDKWLAAVGRNVASLRRSRGWSQARLASLIGYGSGVSICHIEHGRQSLDAYLIERIERLFGASVRP